MQPDVHMPGADTAGAATSERPAATSSRLDLADTLLPLAISQPSKALASASRILTNSADSRELSIAHQAIAIVERDRGNTEESLSHAFHALRLARRVDTERQADVLATLGVVLAHAGRTTDGLARLDEAVRLSPARLLPRMLHRRGYVRGLIGRYEQARHDLTQAIAGSHSLGDTLWEARSLNNRSDVRLGLGDAAGAQTDAVAAQALFEQIGQDFEAAQAVHNRALAAQQAGDLPQALTLLDDAIERYVALGNVRHDLIIDRIALLLAAGLTVEARALGRRTLDGELIDPVRRAELLLVTARAALASGDTVAAEQDSREAARLFAKQLRSRWVDRARLLRLRAQYLEDHPSLLPVTDAEHDPPQRSPADDRRRASRLLGDAAVLVESMRRSDRVELPVALLLHGRIAHDEGRVDLSQRSLVAAAATRNAGPPLPRSAGWLASALLADQRHDRRGVYAACRHGLDAVDEHRGILGDLELRALASGHGLELAQLAVAEAVRSGRPRQLLWWTERWRATALDGSVGRPSDPALSQELAALRDVARRLETADESAPGAQALSRERDRLESSIRQRYRHLRAEASGTGGDPRNPRLYGPDLDALLAELDGGDGVGDDTVLLYLVNDRDTLHLLTASGGRVSRCAVGPLARAHREAEYARFALRRAAHGRRVDLDRHARLLQAALLGDPLPPVVRQLDDARRRAATRAGTGRHVVVVPPAHLLTAPWGLLPALRDAVVTVAPSATQWLRARRLRSTAAETSDAGHVALVTGPGLTTREAEVATLHGLHRGARVLSAERATVAAAVEALEGAALGHVAAHGRFRADAPLFSTLALADGPLTVHDLHGLRRPPRSLVLSACDSGGVAPIGAYEALGLVSSLLGMGTNAVMASVVPVNDVATLAVMTQVHQEAAAGATLGEGLLAARRSADDPLHTATAASFTTWGA